MALALTLATGCGTATTPTAIACAAGAPTGRLNTGVLYQVHLDYRPYATPEALAAEGAEAVVTGRVTGWVPGLVVEEHIPGDRTHYILMRTQVERRLKGASDDVVHVPFYQGPAIDDRGTPIQSQGDFERAVPAGTRVLLFLNRPQPAGTVVEAPQGLPPAHSTPPQGVVLHEVIEDPGGKAVGGRVEMFSSPGWNQPCGIDGLIDRLRAKGFTGD
ncbi:hypothetical protein [Nonomuraea sp. NPDC049480]|uniref:hypothetical protein n=1 Tax=Nonomuraea sp. NPDC049480 TaxID=3364353 RepID=UPI0037B77CE4